jgi:hypothetical protein
VRVTPDTNAVDVRDRAATFYFDETINDRGTGAQEIDNYFLVSPSDGHQRVSWHRSRIDVRPRGSFRPNTAYTITLLPGLTDLRGNTMKGGGSVTFSTGPTIPPHRINGVAFDWTAGAVAPKALLEAMTPDSITYLAQSDSAGRFTLGPLPAGSYLVRAIIDQNGNRALDRNEAFDTLRVTVPQSAPAELLAAVRDTLPARIVTVDPSDSLTLRVTFDRLLDPTSPLPATAFRLVGADSVVVPIAQALSPVELSAETQRAQTAAADSARRADSLAGKPVPPRPAAAIPGAARDSARPGPAAPAKPKLPSPFTAMTLKLGRPLPPSTPYRLSVTNARSLSGKTQSSERTFTTPKPAPPKPASDSTKTPADSVKRVPAAPPRSRP